MLNIGILIYADAQMAAVLGMTDLFQLAGSVADRQARDDAAPSLVVSHWQVTTEGAEPELVYSTHADHRGRPDICILPPSLAGPAAQDCAATAEWLGALHARGAILASVCAGAFVLGATGLLAGRPVTTHWSYEETLRARHPTAAPAMQARRAGQTAAAPAPLCHRSAPCRVPARLGAGVAVSTTGSARRW